jgi:hypothetical protein
MISLSVNRECGISPPSFANLRRASRGAMDAEFRRVFHSTFGVRHSTFGVPHPDTILHSSFLILHCSLFIAHCSLLFKNSNRSAISSTLICFSSPSVMTDIGSAFNDLISCLLIVFSAVPRLRNVIAPGVSLAIIP